MNLLAILAPVVPSIIAAVIAYRINSTDRLLHIVTDFRRMAAARAGAIP